MLIFLIIFAEGLNFTVSGFSSGASMTMQLHFSHSNYISGVGIISGAPYHCVQGSVHPRACLTLPFLINTDELMAQALSHESKGLISALSNIKNSKILLQSRQNDNTIVQGVVKHTEKMYRSLKADVKTVYNLPNKHSFATTNYGNPCWFLGNPFISNCDFDTANQIFSHIYG
jgi:hypothetical protein